MTMQALLQPKQELETQRRAGSLPEYTDDAEVRSAESAHSRNPFNPYPQNHAQTHTKEIIW